MKTVKIWDIETGTLLHVLAAPRRPIALEFDEDVLLVATSKGYLPYGRGTSATKLFSSATDHGVTRMTRLF